MKYFLKLNVVSMLYALVVFIPLELMLNVYRISRLPEWELDTVIVLGGAALCAVFIGGSILIYFLTTNWLDERKVNYVTMILWMPYLVLFVLVFAFLFPITFRGDNPNPVVGLIAMGGTLMYPFYILFLNSLAWWRD